MEPLRFTPEQSAAYRQVLAPDATDIQWTFFLTECERRALVPGVHIIFQLRYSNEFDRQLQREVSVAKVTLVTTINALRLIALRSGKYKGHTPFEYHYMAEMADVLTSSKIPLGKTPHAVSASFYREGWMEPLFATARFDAYKQTKSGGGLTKMWATRSEEQLAKCCEAAGLRTIAPEECGGLYLAEEFGDEPIREAETTSGTPTMLPPAPMVAPAVNQAAAATFADAAESAARVADGPAQAPVVAPAPPPAAPKNPTPPAAPKPPVPKPPAPPKPAQTAVQSAPAQPSPAALQITTAAEAKAAIAADLQREAEALTAGEAADLQRAMDTDKPPKVTPPPAAPAPPPAAPAPPPAAPVTLEGDDVPATVTQYNDIVRGRATKLVRDKLDKVPGAFKPTEAGRVLLAYLLKQSGKAELRKASAATLERIISTLEQATPEDAVKLVKG